MRLKKIALVTASFCALASLLSPEFLMSGKGKLTPAVERFLSAGSNEPLKIWIYFNDHGEGNAAGLRRALSEVTLTDRAIVRRMNRSRGPLIDERDLPVSGAYLGELRSLGVRLRRASKYLNAVSAEATPAQIREIYRLPFVTKIDRVHAYRRSPVKEPGRSTETLLDQSRLAPGRERDRALTTAADYGPSQKQVDMINVIPLHDSNIHGEGVLVAMLDTGFNLRHEALDHLNIIAEWDFIFDDSVTRNQAGDVSNQHNHGTVTLSALAGYAPGALIGPAWGASIILAKTERVWEEVEGEEDDYVRALEWAESLGADVVSSSLGYLKWYTYADLDGNSAITTIAADIAASKGVTVVTAAGNEGPLPWPGIIAPSDGDSVIAVGAVDSSGFITSYSSHGPSFDGRIKPDVMAMGSYVVSASPSDSLGYTTAHGTSLSTPLVAGSVALLLQMHPSWTPIDVLNALRNEASNSATPNNEYGWGIINAYASALSGATGILENVVLDSKVQNQTVRITLTARGGPGATVNLQRRDWGVEVENMWSAYRVVEENIFVDSLSPHVFVERLPPGIYDYRVQLAFDISVVSDQSVQVRIPLGSHLGQSYPNPFVRSGSGRLTIPYTLGGRPIKSGESHTLSDHVDVSLAIYDVTGARVRTLFSELAPPGEYTAEWNGLDDRGVLVSSGVYYYRLSVSGSSFSRKLVFLR
ncbi:MAG: S8 family serine peptidase [Candidatus Latescibacteria bacterium]|nr:S8 family serine peptidase [Candidatus Latescibacterota bacterium]NIM21620.1 S8 family serine peptidase [Candidatus Latescibacterota bacterium]NIM64599.1 S8 family serine peptidase [Candidatus Latescibacterota bacterium]NIO01114.1 S8 family serine peptidase [Candidatus Latescibacterota bacterium]NIO27507.1 S8 family serine peptidase [Candidatus Latescibacterota bacterium]